MSNVHFSTSAYVQLHVLKGGHSRNVNCVAFSPDGAHLASGGDDQALSIWHISQGRLLYRLLFKSAVDTILWHPVHPDTVIVGCANGTLQQVHDFSDLLLTEQYDINLGARTTVHCLDYDATTQRLAIGMGEEVHLTKEHSRNRYHGDLVFPSPPEPEGFSSTGDRRLRPISLHFDQNGSVLIVSYLAHGIVCWDATKRTQLCFFRRLGVFCAHQVISGGAALSPDRSRFAVYNCVDGLDVYPVGPYKKQSPLMSFKFPRAPQSRHGLNVSYVHRGHGLMSGTTTGSVCLWETQTGDLWQALPHDGKDPNHLVP
ncbi:WD40 repeat-like protein [Cubamyces sp. BRFM 1775]|nr:WD40 repeat-like protein [Cubamyces sp. BRFM 1775]